MVAMILFVAAFFILWCKEETYMKKVWKIVGVLAVFCGVSILLSYIMNIEGKQNDVFTEDFVKDSIGEDEVNKTDNEFKEEEDEGITIENNVKSEEDLETKMLIDNVVSNNDNQQEVIYGGDGINLAKLDTDEDGVCDDDESLWGLNFEKKDSDEDGLTDYEEIYLTWTDPVKLDTDGDGISDGASDIDCDNIDNQTEILLNTNPGSADTDGDNLTDFDEIYVYATDPLKVDTDTDGLTDYKEISLGLNPLEIDSNFDGILDSNERITNVAQKKFDSEEGRGIKEVHVEIDAICGEHSKVNITNVYEIDTLSQNVVGLIGVPVEINTEGTFDKASICFYYDESKLGDVKEEDLALLWYDEENNWYQILDDTCVVDTENNRVIYETTHFSTYMLVNSKIWTETWRKNIVYRNGVEKDENPYLDIVFCIDCSKSMEGENILTAKTEMKSYLSAMKSEDSAAIIRMYANDVYTGCNFTNDIDELEACIDSLNVSGWANVDYGLQCSVKTHLLRQNDKRKIIILICDGDVEVAQSTIDYCNKYNVQVYTVNVKNEYVHLELENIAKQTGGQYYYSANLKEMEEVFLNIQDETLNESDTTDTDGDGLFDVYETVGMRLPNGQVICTDPTMADTDGDGISDFQETGMLLEIEDCYIGESIKGTKKFFCMKSDPTKIDTDGDGDLDYEDKYAWCDTKDKIVSLSNKYNDVVYLKIQETNNTYREAGDQTFWKDIADSYAEKNFGDFARDKNYRLWKMGCGVIAVSDVEIYLMQQNSGYNSSINGIVYDESSGIIQKDEYMSYVNLASDLEYGFGSGILEYNAGLMPINMELGLHSFLQMNNHEQTSVKWAPYSAYAREDEKHLLLDEIEKMLNNDLPVVFAYYTAEDDNPIILYKDKEDAKQRNVETKENKTAKAHYMTIIGLHKDFEESTMTYEYILEVVSWGNIYYIRYDDYSDSISYFSNILRIQ